MKGRSFPFKGIIAYPPRCQGPIYYFLVFAFFSLLPIFSARFAPGRERRPLPAAEAGSCEWLRKRGAASGRNSRAGAGAAVQICKRTACATPIWVTATRSCAPGFASAHQSAPQKSAKRKRSWHRVRKRPVTERAIAQRLRGGQKARFKFPLTSRLILWYNPKPARMVPIGNAHSSWNANEQHSIAAPREPLQ